MIIIIKKLIENSYRPFFLHPGNTAEVGPGGGVSRRKSAASLSGKTTLCSEWMVGDHPQLSMKRSSLVRTYAYKRHDGGEWWAEEIIAPESDQKILIKE